MLDVKVMDGEKSSDVNQMTLLMCMVVGTTYSACGWEKVVDRMLSF